MRILSLCFALLLLTIPSTAQRQSSFKVFDALTAAGQTEAFDVWFGAGYPLQHTVQLTITSRAATCTVQHEGCLLGRTVCAVADWEILSAADVDCTSIEMFHVINRPVRSIRVNLTALAGTGATVLAAAETLADTGFPDATNWDEAGDFATPAGTAVYTHSGGTGTMTQTSGNLNTAGVASAHYAATYDVVSQSGDAACTITTAFAAAAVDLDETVGTNTTFFTSAASPGDFVIACTSTSGAITLDNFTITKQNCSVETLVNVTTTSVHGYSTGFLVTITGAVGNTACNVADTAITVIDTTHFTIDGSVGTVKWTSGGTIISDPSVTPRYLGVR